MVEKDGLVSDIVRDGIDYRKEFCNDIKKASQV